MPVEYNSDLCKEKHKTIDREFDVLFGKIRSIEARFWAIILLLIANLAGVLTAIAKG